MTGQHHLPPTDTGPLRPLVLHQLIREELRARIASGAYRPHDRVPSESQLMAHYGVSRITVRQALSDLQNAQLIQRVPGKGSFVLPPKPYQPLDRLQGFGEAMGALGHDTLNHVVALHHVVASAQVAERLRVAPGTAVVEVQRVRHLDQRPVSFDTSWLPQALGRQLAGEDLARRDIFRILEADHGVALGHADLTLEATLADAGVAGHLQVAPGTPVLRMERLTHARDGQPLDYEHIHYRCDHFQFRLRLQRGPTPLETPWHEHP